MDEEALIEVERELVPEAPPEELASVADVTGPGADGPGAPDAPEPLTADAPEPAGPPAAVNGLGVPDWLVQPLVDAAVGGLETMLRTDLPPRLAPLAGRRHPKLSRANRDLLLGSLGRHAKFTEAVYDRIFEESDEEVGRLEGRSVEEVIARVEDGDLEAPIAVSLLFATERPDDATALADWAIQRGAGSDTLTGIIDTLARENLEAQERLRRLEQELGAERRSRRGLERRIERASAAAEAARADAHSAESRAGWTQVERNAEAARAAELEAQVAGLQAAVDAARRERRDLLAEQQDLQSRYQRARQELRELRTRIPVPAPGPVFALRPAEAPPTTAELRDIYLALGTRGVLETKHLLLIVDGWNVGLGHVAAEKLEDKRRVLEQALERYAARTGNSVMVVYDGHKVSWFWMPSTGRRTIARVFTQDQTADDFIVEELAEQSGRAEAPVVVTSDRELRHRCIDQGAFVVSSEDLAGFLRW
ncbi:MAG TPA: NYN domain-containing protein [Actinomycetota bacterium]|nr:NYN domain-containing protein [Actinomycetota bacterium]